MTRRLMSLLTASAFVVLCSSVAAPAARAGIFADPQAAGFAPRVPISGFARAASWFDPARLHLSSTVSVGSGWGSSETSALSVTRLSYQFRAPVTMGVSLGNTFGSDRARSGSSFFLEGLDLTWRPNGNSLFRIEMHDVRSPLQWSPWMRGYGDADPLRSGY